MSELRNDGENILKGLAKVQAPQDFEKSLLVRIQKQSKANVPPLPSRPHSSAAIPYSIAASVAILIVAGYFAIRMDMFKGDQNQVVPDRGQSMADSRPAEDSGTRKDLGEPPADKSLEQENKTVNENQSPKNVPEDINSQSPGVIAKSSKRKEISAPEMSASEAVSLDKTGEKSEESARASSVPISISPSPALENAPATIQSKPAISPLGRTVTRNMTAQAMGPAFSDTLPRNLLDSVAKRDSLRLDSLRRLLKIPRIPSFKKKPPGN